MKKIAAWLTALLLLCPLMTRAESAAPVFDALRALMNGRQFTLTVSAEAEGELAETAAAFGPVTCRLWQEEDQILLQASCEGDAYLNAAATAQGVRFDTNLIENGAFESDWAALAPAVQLEENLFSVSMTGPDHEMIRFTCRLSGTSAADCRVIVDIGYITGPGNVHTLWDEITHENGETAREFYFTFSEEEYGIAGEGAVACEETEDGGLVITRDEECIVTYQEDELGTVIFHSVLSIFAR